MGLGNLLTYVARSYSGYEGRGDAQLVATNTSDTQVVGKSRQGFGLGPTRSRRRRKGKSPKKGGGIKRKRDVHIQQEIERRRRRRDETIAKGVVIFNRAVQTLRAHQALNAEDVAMNWSIEKIEEHQNELYQSLSDARKFIREAPPYIIQSLEALGVDINRIRNVVIPRLQREVRGLDFAVLVREEDDDASHERMFGVGGRKRKTRKKRTRKKRGRGSTEEEEEEKRRKPTPVKIPKGNDGTKRRPPKNTGNSSPVVDVSRAMNQIGGLQVKR